MCACVCVCAHVRACACMCMCVFCARVSARECVCVSTHVSVCLCVAHCPCSQSWSRSTGCTLDSRVGYRAGPQHQTGGERGAEDPSPTREDSRGPETRPVTARAPPPTPDAAAVCRTPQDSRRKPPTQETVLRGRGCAGLARWPPVACSGPAQGDDPSRGARVPISSRVPGPALGPREGSLASFIFSQVAEELPN